MNLELNRIRFTIEDKFTIENNFKAQGKTLNSLQDVFSLFDQQIPN